MQPNQISSGGLGATSAGLVELIIEGAMLLLVLWGAWKLARIVWAAISH